MSNQNPCADPSINPCANAQTFPAPINNRPSLPRIQYRIGRYSDFRQYMLGQLDIAPLLLPWTHRQPDDPGIALLEGAVILADILTFYQELYANEAWLRTATWPQSIRGLVKLLGYRPAPGIGGEGLVAFEIGGTDPIMIPPGFPLSAQILGSSTPVDLETSASMIAVPALSKFSLYAPSDFIEILGGASQFSAAPVDVATAGITLKAKDRLMLVEGGELATGTSAPAHQIVVVQSVSTVLDQTVITIAGGWQKGYVSAGSTLTAYKLGRTFRAFGYNAPQNQFVLDSTTNLLTSENVDTTMPAVTMMQGFPLEQQVNNLSAGITMLLDVHLSDSTSTIQEFFFVANVEAVNSGTDTVGPLIGGMTTVAFPLPTSPPIGNYTTADRRKAICHEVIGGALPVQGIRDYTGSTQVDHLDSFMDGPSYQALDGRTLQFVWLNPDDTAQVVQEAVATIDPTLIAGGDIEVRSVSLKPALTNFSLEEFYFPLSNPIVQVFGNVAPVTQGKTQKLVALGNGDARAMFQSFQLPKAPLTWLTNEALTPPRQPEVTILVNQIAWTQVDSLFASGPTDSVYVLREDNSGNTWVQFGDGLSGARLPSGVNNVVAQYRTGTGANGMRKSGTKPQASGKVQNFSAVHLYDEITLGCAEETGDHARQSAPGRVESLGRLVSLEDFEAEALQLPGVEKAQAQWDTSDGVPSLQLAVLLADNSTAQQTTIQTQMSQANLARGAARFAVIIQPVSPEYVYLSLTVTLLPGYQTTPVTAAIIAALGVLPSDGSAPPMGGLFSVDQRDIAEEEYARNVEGTVQNVEGVAWVEVTAFGGLGAADDPSTLSQPTAPALNPTVACDNYGILALYAAQIKLSVSAGGQ